MEAYQARYSYGAFEATDKEEILEQISVIQENTNKINKKQGQGRPTEREEKILEDAKTEIRRSSKANKGGGGARPGKEMKANRRCLLKRLHQPAQTPFSPRSRPQEEANLGEGQQLELCWPLIWQSD